MGNANQNAILPFANARRSQNSQNAKMVLNCGFVLGFGVKSYMGGLEGLGGVEPPT